MRANFSKIKQRVKDVKIDNNWFYQTYDSALTWQGNQTNNIYKNI